MIKMNAIYLAIVFSFLPLFQAVSDLLVVVLSLEVFAKSSVFAITGLHYSIGTEAMV